MEIQNLAQDFLNDYLYLAVGVVGGANTDVEQKIYQVTRFEKRDKLQEILNEIGDHKVMIFIQRKVQTDTLAFFLIQKGYAATSLHGDRLQSQREEALRDFKSGKAKIIVGTAVAARGLDIDKVSHVINYDLPSSIDEYVHRIGRTGRCGNIGRAISFFDPTSADDVKLARPLVHTFTQAQQIVPEWLLKIAEGNFGSNYMGTACTNDLRKTMTTLSITEPASEETDEVWG